MKAALVIMAAGLGSRYGGNKQVDGVGPDGEILMEYSIYDAIRAGFTKVVFIIKPDMVDLMHRICGDYVARGAGFYQCARLLYHPAPAAEALRNGPRCSMRPELCEGALLCH